MLAINQAVLRRWSDQIGISDLGLAEIDFRLLHALQAIVTDEMLGPRLMLKGGTALNKLYLADLSRLSVDLDFNHLGEKSKVQQERRAVVDQIQSLLAKQDKYGFELRRRYDKTTLVAHYTSASANPNQRLKIEISHIERFPLLPLVTRSVITPDGTQLRAQSYSIEELLATKLRAFYERRKGRDIYDLRTAGHNHTLDPNAIRKIFLYYFYRSRNVFNPQQFFSVLARTIEQQHLEDDLKGFLRASVSFDLYAGAREVLQFYRFLEDLDDRDRDFLLLARTLLHKGEIPKGKKPRIRAIEHPLAELFGNGGITEQARNATIADIAMYER